MLFFSLFINKCFLSKKKQSKETNNDLRTTDRILVQMKRKTLTNKLILCFIIVLLGLIIAILIYVKIRRLLFF